MVSSQRRELTRAERLHLINSLREFKKNSELYNLGDAQKKVLDALPIRVRKARTSSDLLEIHSNTCALGLEKM